MSARLDVSDRKCKTKQKKVQKVKKFDIPANQPTQLGGLNGALYFVSMPADGGVSATNKAGTKFGTGYCDAQCPKG
jgi:hypothetical protein